MFVPVSCTSCGKPFQVPEAVLGQHAPCPWCQAVVVALPVSAPVPQQQTQSDAKQQAASPLPTQQEPLSLDDDPPAAAIPVKRGGGAAPPPPKPRPAAPPPPPEQKPLPAAPPPPATSTKFPLVMIGVGVLVLLVVMAGTMIYRGYGRGQVSERGWSEYTSPDGSFTVMLPGEPKEEDVDADHANSLGPGKRFVVHRWYSKTSVWVMYHDLDPVLVSKLPADRDRVFAAGVLRAARERERARFNGTVVKEAEVRVDSAWGVELHMDTPSGTVIEWLVLMGEGSRPRLYAFGVQAKDITPQSPPCSKLFGTFRANK